MSSSTLRKTLLAAAGAMILAVSAASPALADPPWRRGGPHGWSEHHDRGEHRGWDRWDDRPAAYYRGGPSYYYVYERPRVVYVPPPPVVYFPPRAGIEIYFPLP